MKSNATIMKCPECGKEYPLDSLAFRCEKCNQPIEVLYDYEHLSDTITRKSFLKRDWTTWRYRELLPIRDEINIVSLHEGGVPLIKSHRLAEIIGIKNLYLKDETRNPTMSFKDIGTTVGVTKALEVDANAVGCVTTGNMGASVSAYSAKAGIKCIILVPSQTPLEKIAQILVHGALVLAVNLPYPELYKMSFEMNRKFGVYLVHADSPMRVEGQKTTAFELCEQLNWKIPDVVLIPTSSGGYLSAIWKGFKEFYEIGFIDRLPRMVCIQSEGCAPIVKAFKERKPDTEVWPNPHTIAHAISNSDPSLASSRRVLKILAKSKGTAEAASDEEISNAQKLLAIKEGIFAEPASAAPIAGLKKLIEKGLIDKNESATCIITGSGLKDVESALKICEKTITVDSWDEFRKKLGKIIEK